MHYFFLILLFMSSYTFSSESIHFKSNGYQPQLIQLFTSQGCSSCPPAEKYLNNFIDNEHLWKDKIPMAFHVDYWNYLGWKDPFSTAPNTSLQYNYKKHGNIKSVYTPGFVIDGKEWKGFFGIKRLPTHALNNNILSAKLKDKKLIVNYEINSQPLILHTAILGIDITTDIKSGENEGKLLTQHFVVLGKSQTRSPNGQWQLNLPKIIKSNAKRFAVAIWITTPNDLNPIQAAADWLPTDLTF